MCGVSRSDVTTCSHMCSLSQLCAHSEVRASLTPIDLRVPVTGRFPTKKHDRESRVTFSTSAQSHHPVTVPARARTAQMHVSFASQSPHSTLKRAPLSLGPTPAFGPRPRPRPRRLGCMSLRKAPLDAVDVLQGPHPTLGAKPAVDATRVAKERSTRLDQELFSLHVFLVITEHTHISAHTATANNTESELPTCSPTAISLQ